MLIFLKYSLLSFLKEVIGSMRKSAFAVLAVLGLTLFLPFSAAAAVENASSIVYPVGELGEKWQFPSDHLPIGLTAGNIHVATWNTLNTRYIYHILTNQQGLRDSLIVDANVPLKEGSPLTLRESQIIDQVSVQGVIRGTGDLVCRYDRYE